MPSSWISHFSLLAYDSIMLPRLMLPSMTCEVCESSARVKLVIYSPCLTQHISSCLSCILTQQACATQESGSLHASTHLNQSYDTTIRIVESIKEQQLAGGVSAAVWRWNLPACVHRMESSDEALLSFAHPCQERRPAVKHIHPNTALKAVRCGLSSLYDGRQHLLHAQTGLSRQQ